MRPQKRRETMAKYEISNTLSGHSFGAYEAEDEAGALEAMAHEAGYSSYAEACEESPVSEGEISVRRIA